MRNRIATLAGVFVIAFATHSAQAQYGYGHHSQSHSNKAYKVVKNGYVYNAPSYYRAAPVRIQPAPIVSYVFGGRGHLDTLADKLRSRARSVLLEMHPYRNHFKYRAAYRRMYEIYSDANHIHDLVHHATYLRTRHSVDHIARDLHDIDRAWHDLEHDLSHLSFGPNMRSRAKRFESTLHHLMEDYGVHSRLVAPPVVYQPSPYYWGGGGIPY